MPATAMAGVAPTRPLAGPLSCVRGSAARGRPTAVCSVQVRAASALAVREDVAEQAQLASVPPSAAGNGAAPWGEAAPTTDQVQRPAAGSAISSSPWQQQRPRSPAADVAELEARLAMAAAGQRASVQGAGDPADTQHQRQQQQRGTQPARRRQPVSRASEPAGTADAPAAHQRQRQPPQRRRMQPPNGLHRSARPAQPAAGHAAPLQTAVRSNKQHDWQVTRDWLLMEMSDTNPNDDIYADITDAADLPDSCRPQVAFYHALGMAKAEICRMARNRTQLFHLALPTIESKLKFLREEAGIADGDDVRKLLLKFPRIVEYKTERTLRPRLDFLRRYNIEGKDISKVVMRAPAMLELSVGDTLEPRVEFLRTAACVPEDSLAKVLVRCPSLLTCTEAQMQLRVDFLRAIGVDDAQMAKAVTAFPQMLYLKVEAMADKVRYLHSIGVEGPQMGKVISRLPQLLSLDVANNMAPKFEYLCSELGGTAATIAGFPAYFSLSMPQRIVPRHRYLQKVHTQKHWPFPMTYLKLTDETFARDVAGTPLDEFVAFRNKVAASVAPPAARSARHPAPARRR